MQSSTHETNGTVYVAPDLILSVHVDDIHAAGRNQGTINAFKAELQKHFQITELGPIKRFLGLQFETTRTEEGQTLTIHQENYIEGLLTRYGMKECKPRATPLDKYVELNIDKSAPIDTKRLRKYREIIGSLTHCMQGTRPDIAFAVSLMSKALANPTDEHIQHTKHIMRYLRRTTKQGLTYKSSAKGQFNLHAYTDADFAGGALPDGKSTSGYVFFLAGGPICWQSKRQSVHYQRQAIEDGTIKFIYISTNEMAADGLTKPFLGRNSRDSRSSWACQKIEIWQRIH